MKTQLLTQDSVRYQTSDQDKDLFEKLKAIRDNGWTIVAIEKDTGVDRQVILRALKGSPITRFQYIHAVKLIEFIKKHS